MICTPVTGCPCELATVPPTDAVMAAADMLTSNASANKTEQLFFKTFPSTPTTLLSTRPRMQVANAVLLKRERALAP